MKVDPVDFIRTQTKILAPAIVPEVVLHMAAEVTPLWQMTEQRLKQADLPPPYWAFAWPGGQGMARFILDHPDIVKGKKVVDFAAGSGIAAIAAMKAGAKRTLAVDIDPLALTAIKLNAELNGVPVEISDGLNLSKSYTKADIILAGDICYQQATSTSVTRWLRFCVEEDVSVYLADPGRAYVPEQGLEKIASYEVPTSLDLEDHEMRTVIVSKMEKIKE